MQRLTIKRDIHEHSQICSENYFEMLSKIVPKIINISHKMIKTTQKVFV